VDGVFVSREGQQRVDLTHSPARGNAFFIRRIAVIKASQGYRAVYQAAELCGFKEAVRATSRDVAVTESDQLKHTEAPK
jgi:hypothetical protein